jgi:nucleotide-binding universal stress UspA family protein
MPIVVGIDGSESAINAAQWAVDEAVSRDLPLRLVHVIEPGSEAVRLEEEYAEIALRTARTAVEDLSGQVTVETAIRRGDIDAILTEESWNAEMICIGSADPETLEEPLEGDSTAAALARSAGCSLVVIGSSDEQVESKSGCVAVIVDGSNTGDAILGDALNEARFRRLSLVVLEVQSPVLHDSCRESAEQRMTRWQADYPDVDVHWLAMRTDVASFLTEIARSVAMTIVGGTESGTAAELVECPTNVAELHHRPPGRGRLPNGRRRSAREFKAAHSDSVAVESTSGSK